MVTKQELINFIENFKGESIVKQDVLDFIAGLNETKLTVLYADIQVNGGEEQGWYSERTLKEVLGANDFAKKVSVEFKDDDDDVLTKAETATVVEFFLNKGYKMTAASENQLTFEK
jgi:hypothetical protein